MAEGGSVLVIVPDLLLCETIVAVLEDAGMTVVACEDAHGAQPMLDADSIDVVLAVVGLAVEPIGARLRAWIAASPARRRRVILLHSTTYGEQLAASLDVRALRMPFGVEDLVAETRGALEFA